MSKPVKEKIPESVTGGSVKSTLVSFAISIIYGAIAAIGFASGREMLEYIIGYFTTDLIVNAGNAAGYANLATIISIVVMGLLWLATFMIVWYKTERASSMRFRFHIGASWILAALAFIAITFVVVYFMTGAWPTLMGG